MSEEILYQQEEVIKIRNSRKRYLKIPDGYFKEISHGDVTEKIVRIDYPKENPKEIQIIYIFNKNNLKNKKRN